MYIEFAMAQKYIDDLSRNVRRGLQTKSEKGWDTVGQPCEGEDVTTLPVGESTGRSTTMFSLRAVRDDLHHFCRRK